MAGLSDTGFTIKRLQEVISSYEQKARELFADLVPDGDTVDVRANTALGRMIGIVTPSATDLWEAAQDVYSAFDPNSATGVQLDNLVALGNLQRFPARRSNALLRIHGNLNTIIPLGSKAGSNATTVSFMTTESIRLDLTQAKEVHVTVATVASSANYVITVTDGVYSKTFTYNSGAGATAGSIIAGITNLINVEGSSRFVAVNETDYIRIESLVEQNVYNFTISANLATPRVTKYVTADADVDGAIQLGSGEIDKVQTAIAGWLTVTNPYPVVAGRSEETDDELRERFEQAKFTMGSNFLDALYSDLINIEGVDEVKIYENVEDVVSPLDLPPHSYMAVVSGISASDSEIGKQIWRNKPAGIEPQGTTEVQVKDVQGITRVVRFQKPTLVPVYISVEIKLDPNTQDEFPLDGELQIKNAIVQYFKDTMKLDQDVRISRLYTPINSIKGFFVDSLTIGLAPNPTGTSDITINATQMAITEVANIEVEIVT